MVFNFREIILSKLDNAIAKCSDLRFCNP